MNDITASDPAAPSSSASDHFLAKLARLAIVIAAAALVGLVLIQGWQVFARYVLNDSPSWSEPLTLLLLSTAMSFSAASGVHSAAHFAFSLLAQKAPPWLQRVLAAVTHLVVVLIGLVLAVGAYRLFIDGLDIRMAGASLPQSAAYAPLMLGGVLIVVFGLQHLWRVFAAHRSETN
jgi:TRAP-type C4-dicarboxylate transport system permease small subunit